jgi:hypothetical protein
VGESEQHITFVAAIERWIQNIIIPKRQGIVFKDTSATNPAERSPVIFGYVPDIYFKSTDGCLVIVGEAKIRSDLENRHTVAQLEGFLRHCQAHESSMLVIAVPWDMVRLAKSMTHRIKRKVNGPDVEIVILEKLVG